MSDSENNGKEQPKDPEVIMEVTNGGKVHYPGKEDHAVVFRIGRLKVVDKDKKKK